MIELDNVSKVFYKRDSPMHALSELSMRVEEGEIFGVIGASGAGKSTLIRCINLLERPTGGRVVVNGRNLLELSPGQLTLERRHIGMIFQHFNLLSSRTVFENVAFPLELSGMSRREITIRVMELLNLVGLEEKQRDYPASLSGGQKQRVAIARTLANNPKILLCDEATSALDPETTRQILSLLKDINRRFSITILLITHEMNVVKAICDKVAVISEGRLIEQGTVNEVFAHPRSALTRQFIQSSFHFTVPPEYEQRLSELPGDGKHPLVKLEFTGQSSRIPVLSETSRLFEINNHVVSAQMDFSGGAGFGIMLIELSGKPESTQAAIQYYIDHQIKAEVLGYV